MVNTKMFYHPNYYKELAKEKRSLRKGSSVKQQATSRKGQAMTMRNKQLERLILKIHSEWAFKNGYESKAPSNKLSKIKRYKCTSFKEGYKPSRSKQQAS